MWCMDNVSSVNIDGNINNVSSKHNKPASFDEKAVKQSTNEVLLNKENPISTNNATERTSSIEHKNLAGTKRNDRTESPFAGRTFGASSNKTFLKQNTGDAVAEHKAKSQE